MNGKQVHSKASEKNATNSPLTPLHGPVNPRATADKNTKPKSALRQLIEAYAILSGMGFYFCAVLGITIYLGHLADEMFGLGHKGKLVGALIGFPLAIFSLWRRLKSFHL